MFFKKKEKEIRKDGIYNIYTKVGTSKDRRTATSILNGDNNEQLYESLYDNSSMAQKIVDIYAKESTREFIDLSNFETNEKIKFENELKRLNVKENIFKCIHNSKLYGAGIIFIVDDTPVEKLYLPLTNTKIIKNLIVFNNFELQASIEKETDISNPYFGKPLYYTINKNDLSSLKIHYSRLLIIQGEECSKELYEQNDFFNISCLYRLTQIIKDWQISYDIIPDIIAKFNLLSLKMNGMIDLLEADAVDSGNCIKAQEIIENKVDALNEKITSLSIGIIDKEDELNFINPSITGIETLYNRIDKRLIADSDIPHTILFGESPQGSNSTANSTTVDWYNKIKSYQETKVRPVLEKLFTFISSYLNIENTDFEFFPLWQQTDKEQADTRKIIADTDNIYIGNGVLSADEVRENRFGGKLYSINTTIEGDIEEEVDNETDKVE